MFAVLYAYIEATFVLHNQNALNHFLALLSEMSRNVPFIYTTLSNLQQEFARNQASSLLQQPQDLAFTSNQIVTNFQLNPANDYGALNACLVLCTYLNIKGTFFFMQQEINNSDLNHLRSSEGGRNCEFEIFLCGGRGKIYQLYKCLAVDSFVTPTCGHLMLKYNVLARLAAFAGNYSFNSAWATSLQLQCTVCSGLIQPADIDQVLPYPSQARTRTVRPGNCIKCRGFCELSDKCPKCSAPICVNCAVVVFCTTGRPVCHNCGYDLLDTFQGKQLVVAYMPWLRRIIEIATSDYQKSRANEPVHNPPIEAAAVPSQQSRVRTSQTSANSPNPQVSQMCKHCKKEVQSEAGLCPKKCYCFVCEWEHVFAEDYAHPKCQACKIWLNTELIRVKPCSLCRREATFQSTFFSCYKCEISFCRTCALRTTREGFLHCSASKQRHWITESKLKAIGVGNDGCSVW